MSGAGRLKVWDAEGGVRFSVRVQPRASRTEVAGLIEGALKVRLTAPPADGRANRQLLEFLASLLDVPKSRLELVAGAASRRKTVALRGVSAEELQAKLAPHGV